MTALLVVVMIIAFLAVDLLVRMAGRRLAERRERREREAALDTAVRLDVSHEAPSLKRVGVPHPRGRILAVDDEAVVLDSFRKILVLEGFDVDTVESGPEALGLVQRHDYDFVFTDLKMPGMDGVEVVKGVRHLRPDVDVAVITGYGTIETAVETMQHGAVDYVQKPFTAEELSEFARTLLIRRQARLEAQRRPTVRVVAPGVTESSGADAAHEFRVPGGAFLSGGHAWARIEPGGQVRVGLDDFGRKALGPIDAVELPARGAHVRRGEPLFTLRHGEEMIRIASPMTGRVAHVNEALLAEPSRVMTHPYDRGWACLLEPSDLAGELPALRIGQPVVAWYQEEIARLRQLEGKAGKGTLPVGWEAFQREFLARDSAVRRAPAPVG